MSGGEPNGHPAAERMADNDDCAGKPIEDVLLNQVCVVNRVPI